MQNGIFYYQLLGIIAAGSFIGQFWRSSVTDVDLRVFLANFLAGAFLSYVFIIGYYSVTEHKESAIVFGGLLSFQDINYLIDKSRRAVDKEIG